MWCLTKINTTILKTTLRSFSSAKENLITFDINNKTGIAILSLNRSPVNALGLDLLKQFSTTIKNLEDDKCRGLILTSNLKKVFSAGLDIKELYKPQRKRFEQYYAAFQDSWLTLYSCHLPTAAMINGHSPAGGCVYATCCDYRVMMPNLTIGLNEVLLGLIPPKYVAASFGNVVEKRVAEMALTQGKIFTTEEALKIGLVDELAVSKHEGIEKCEKFLLAYKGVIPEARTLTKLQFRKSDIEEFHKNKIEDLNTFVSRVMEPEFQMHLEKYVESINKTKI